MKLHQCQALSVHVKRVCRREGIKLVRPIERPEKPVAMRHRPKDNSLQGPEQRQPCTMKLGRDHAVPCTAQCDKEVCSCERVRMLTMAPR